jgi:hypothetical protein
MAATENAQMGVPIDTTHPAVGICRALPWV